MICHIDFEYGKINFHKQRKRLIMSYRKCFKVTYLYIKECDILIFDDGFSFRTPYEVAWQKNVLKFGTQLKSFILLLLL